jgi:CRP-like cAMP-binding protein
MFSELDADELSTIASLAQTKSAPKDTVIFHAGDPADAVYVVATGKVKIVTTSSDGKEFIGVCREIFWERKKPTHFFCYFSQRQIILIIHPNDIILLFCQ